MPPLELDGYLTDVPVTPQGTPIRPRVWIGQLGRRQSNLRGRRPNQRLAQAIAGPLDLDDDGVVKEPIGKRSCDDGIAEDLSPFGEAAV